MDELAKDVTYAQAAYINGSLRVFPGSAEEYLTWVDNTPEENMLDSTDAASGLEVHGI